VQRNHLIEVNLIDKFLDAIKTHPRMDRHAPTPIVVAIESCDGHVMHIEPMVLNSAMRLGLNVKVMTETHNEMDGITKGVPKTDKTTSRMVISIGIALDTKIIGIPADCVSVSSDFAIARRSMDEDLLTLERQFAAYTLIGKKYTGKSGGKNDDLLITFMMSFYWSIVFCHDEKRQYAEFMMMFPIFRTWDSGTVDGLAEATREISTW
jgi:hypothetical protein